MEPFELSLSALAAQDPRAEAARVAVNRGREAQGLAPRSAALWRWRAAAPDGAVLGLATRGGEVLAAIVGVRRAVRIGGEEDVEWIEVVDVLNAFDAGEGLLRARPLLALAEAFAEAHGGDPPERAPVHYGVPTRRAHRLLLGRLGMEVLRTENALAVAPSSVRWRPGEVSVEEAEPAPDELGRLFALHARDRWAVLVRDASRLAWRYRDHPERRYRLGVARRGDELVGYAVLRVGAWAGLEAGLLVDWVVPGLEEDVAMALLAWARDASGLDLLVTNVPDKSPEFALLQAVGFRVRGADELLAFRGYQRRFLMSALFDGWTTCLGDTERG